MAERRGRRSGQALVEFAISVPILVLLVAGVLELGRGYAFAMATSDAARDGARYVAGKTSTTNGPGLANMCSLVTADLASVTSLYESEVDVYVYYGFSDLNLLGGGITISGSSRATTSW